MTCCFSLHCLKLEVTFNDSLLWHGEGEGVQKYEEKNVQFLDVSGYTDHFKKHFFIITKIIILMEWLDPINSIKFVIFFNSSLSVSHFGASILYVLSGKPKVLWKSP